MHYRIEDFSHLGHQVLLRALWYLALVGGGLIAVYEHSPGLVVTLGVAAGLTLAVTERVRKLGCPGRNLSLAPSGLPLGDGGCFPGGAPLRERTTQSSVVVIDGGSLEHQRDRPLPLSMSRHQRWWKPTRALSNLHQHPTRAAGKDRVFCV